jgi:hypothetical protein
MISHVFLWVWKIFETDFVDITFTNFLSDFKAILLQNVTSIVLQTPVIWC